MSRRPNLRARRPAPRAWKLTVHLPCVRLRGWAGADQGCPCEPSEPWPGCDVSRARDLCLVCARGTAGGVTRWSWLACTHCRAVEKALQEWLGMRVLPLGRHSILNGVALAVATASPEDAEAFGVRFEGLSLGWDRLYEWGDAEARRLAAGVVGPRPDVPLDVWQQLFRPSLTASIDAYERILETSLPPAVREHILQDGRRR